MKRKIADLERDMDRIANDPTKAADWYFLSGYRQALIEQGAQKTMRSRSEVEEHLHTLVGILAHNDPADDSYDEAIPRIHARVLDLIWVLYPGLTLAEMLQLSNDMIAERKNGD